MSRKPTKPFVIRPMREDDLGPARLLLGELGYELTSEDLKERFEVVSKTNGHLVLVAEQASRVIGLVHVYTRPALEKPLEGVVQALVVEASSRNLGVGEALMASVERWAGEQGLPSVSLGSNVTRTAAHAFYARLGYLTVGTYRFLRREFGSRPGRGASMPLFDSRNDADRQ